MLKNSIFTQTPFRTRARKLLLTTFIILAFLLINCSIKKVPTSTEEQLPEYVPGEIILGLKDDLPYEKAKEIISRFPGVNIVDLVYHITCYTESSSVASLITEMEKSPYISSVSHNPEKRLNGKYVLIIYTQSCATWAYFENLIKSFPEIEKDYSYTHMLNMALISVKVGLERTYIAIFKNLEPEIEYAHLNWYLHAAS